MIKRILTFCSMLVCFGIGFHAIKKAVKAFSITDDEIITEVENKKSNETTINLEYTNDENDDLDIESNLKHDCSEELTEEEREKFKNGRYKVIICQEALIENFVICFGADEELLNKYLSLPYAYRHEIFRMLCDEDIYTLEELYQILLLSKDEILQIISPRFTWD